MPAKDTPFEGNSRFTVSRKLGEGGMGVVFEALDQDRNIRVALKTLLNLSPNGLLFFKQEFRSVVDIVQPNLVSLDELFADQEVWFFTMELLQGRNLIEGLRTGCHPCEFSVEESADAAATRKTVAELESPFRRDLDGADGVVVREPKVLGTAPDPATIRDAMLQVLSPI